MSSEQLQPQEIADQVDLELKRAEFIKRYTEYFRTLAPEEAAKFFWMATRNSWSQGFAEARVIIEKREGIKS